MHPQYIVKVEQQKATATTGFAQAGSTCGQLVTQYMAFLHKTLTTAPPTPAPAPAPVPLPAVGGGGDIPGLDSLDGAPDYTQDVHTRVSAGLCVIYMRER